MPKTAAKINRRYGMEKDRNLRLCAAAPDLLQVCEAILKRLDLEPADAIFPCSAMREDLRRAIAKAFPEP